MLRRSRSLTFWALLGGTLMAAAAGFAGWWQVRPLITGGVRVWAEVLSVEPASGGPATVRVSYVPEDGSRRTAAFPVADGRRFPQAPGPAEVIVDPAHPGLVRPVEDWNPAFARELELALALGALAAAAGALILVGRSLDSSASRRAKGPLLGRIVAVRSRRGTSPWAVLWPAGWPPPAPPVLAVELESDPGWKGTVPVVFKPVTMTGGSGRRTRTGLSAGTDVALVQGRPRRPQRALLRAMGGAGSEPPAIPHPLQATGYPQPPFPEVGGILDTLPPPPPHWEPRLQGAPRSRPVVAVVTIVTVASVAVLALAGQRLHGAPSVPPACHPAPAVTPSAQELQTMDAPGLAGVLPRRRGFYLGYARAGALDAMSAAELDSAFADTALLGNGFTAGYEVVFDQNMDPSQGQQMVATAVVLQFRTAGGASAYEATRRTALCREQFQLSARSIDGVPGATLVMLKPGNGSRTERISFQRGVREFYLYWSAPEATPLPPFDAMAKTLASCVVPGGAPYC